MAPQVKAGGATVTSGADEQPITWWREHMGADLVIESTWEFLAYYTHIMAFLYNIYSNILILSKLVLPYPINGNNQASSLKV